MLIDSLLLYNEINFELCFETQTWYIFFLWEYKKTNWNADMICFFLWEYKKLRAIVTFISSNSFQSSISDGFIISFNLCLYIKGLTFGIPPRCFQIYSWFNVIVVAYWKHLSSFLLKEFIAVFYRFLSNQDNIYMIHQDLDLFYDNVIQ